MNRCLRSGRARFPGRVLPLRPSSASIVARRHFAAAPWRCDAQPARSVHTTDWDPDGQSKYWPPLVPAPRGPQRELKYFTKWFQYMERYLPPELRRDPSDHTPPRGDENLQCRVITRVLHDARLRRGFDLLTLLGTEYGKWDTAYRIMEKLLDYANASRSGLKPGCLPSNLDWGNSATLQSIARGDCESELTPPVLNSDDYPALTWYDKYEEDMSASNRMGEDRLEFGIMEEIWQGLAGMVIEAVDLPAEESRLVMSYFYRIVARLHHQNFIPPTLYKYVMDEDPESCKRPPTLHILSTRIMDVLFDAVWTAQDAESAAKAIAAGEERPVRRFRMRLRELGPEVWLDFVLWCCVEGGFAKEGVYILKSLHNREKKWVTKSWASVLSPSEKINVAAVDRYETWADCVEPSLNGADREPSSLFRGMGERTISTDVVRALIDGVFTFARLGVGYRGDKIEYILGLINSAAPLLCESGLYSSPNEVDALIVRILECRGLFLELDPRAAHLSLDIALQLSSGGQDTMSLLEKTGARNGASGSSPLVLGLYQYIMDVYSANGLASGAIDVFDKLLPALTTAKLQPDQPPNRDDEMAQQRGLNEPHMSQLPVDAPQLAARRSISTQFTNVSLALLLDVATTSDDYRLAYELLLSPTPIISTDLLRNPAVASAALRSIAATGATHLLPAIYKHVGTPLPTSVLKSLILYTISDRKFDDTAQLLRYLRDTRVTHWSISNVTDLAAAILRLEGRGWEKGRGKPQSPNLKKAVALLTDVLDGRYDLQGEHVLRTHHQEALLHTLGRIFTSTPGALADLCPGTDFWDKNIRVPLRLIPGTAFNHYLSGLVDTRGSIKGKEAWDRWCLDPLSPEAQRITPGGNSLLYFSSEMDPRLGVAEPKFDHTWFHEQTSKLARPNVGTLRIIAQAALSELIELKNGRDPNCPDITEEISSEVYSWAQTMFKRFRFTQDEIDREMRESYRRVEERNWERTKYL